MGRKVIGLECVARTLIMALVAVGPARTDDQAAVMRFTLDGKPIQPAFLSLAGTPERPAPGDLISIDGFFLVYTGEAAGDFRSTPPEDGRLFVRNQDGKERVVGAKIGWTYIDDTELVCNWPGIWPGDGALRDKSALAVCQWLAKHGAPASLEQYENGKRAGRAARRRMTEYARLLPGEVLDRASRAQSPDEGFAAFQLLPVNRIERARPLVRLFGCDQGSWNLYSGLDGLLNEVLLPKVTNDELVKALDDKPDAAMLNGAGRWLFGEGKWKTLDRATLDSRIPIVGRFALAHPREVNRRMTLRALGACPDGLSTPLLRKVLVGEIPVRPLAEQDRDEPGGMVSVEPSDDVSSGSDRAVAALLLAKAHDRESFAAIRRLAQAAKGQDKAVLNQTLKLLDGPKKPLREQRLRNLDCAAGVSPSYPSRQAGRLLHNQQLGIYFRALI
jgi:hypothetical protein